MGWDGMEWMRGWRQGTMGVGAWGLGGEIGGGEFLYIVLIYCIYVYLQNPLCFGLLIAHDSAGLSGRDDTRGVR